MQNKGADFAKALALMAATVPLPPATAAALRLVCRATKITIDASTKHLHLSMDGAKGLVSVGNPLTAGLTSLRFDAKTDDNDDEYGQEYSAAGLFNACRIAFTNSETLEHLQIFPGMAKEIPVDDARVALSILGDHTWPRLRSIDIFCVPCMFDKYFPLECVPVLTELRLHGALTPYDVTDIRHDLGLTARLEVLELSGCGPEEQNIQYFDSTKALLRCTSRLRHLKLCVTGGGALTFLVRASLPDLEVLELDGLDDGVSLKRIYRTPRPRQRVLRLNGGKASPADPEALVSNLHTAFPALEELRLSFWSDSWEFMRGMRSTSLKSLTFEGALLEDIDVEVLAVALAQLPALERLVFCPITEYKSKHTNIIFSPGSQYLENLFSGPPLLSLRRFETGGSWADGDSSLAGLIEASDSVPNLEEIVMRLGMIGTIGFALLAQAGRRGAWPNLRLFQISEVFDDDEPVTDQEYINACVGLVEAVWPGLEVKIRVE